MSGVQQGSTTYSATFEYSVDADGNVTLGNPVTGSFSQSSEGMQDVDSSVVGENAKLNNEVNSSAVYNSGSYNLSSDDVNVDPSNSSWQRGLEDTRQSEETMQKVY